VRTERTWVGITIVIGLPSAQRAQQRMPSINDLSKDHLTVSSVGQVRRKALSGSCMRVLQGARLGKVVCLMISCPVS
jgi:hypothetical protein